MPPSVVLSDPWSEPKSHWRLDGKGRQSDETSEGRRPSGQELRIVPDVRKRGDRPQLFSALGSEGASGQEPHSTINKIRVLVGDWLKDGAPGLCSASSLLLDHWRFGQSDPKPFFCQVEAAATMMWLNEAHGNGLANGAGDIHDNLNEWAEKLNDGIPRIAIKMATGTGKTQVMAMLCAWWWAWRTSLGETSVCALAIAPNLVIKRRLSSLDPNTPEGEEAYRDIIPPGMGLPRISVAIENYHQFQRQTAKVMGDSLSKDHKALLTGGDAGGMTHLDESMQDVLSRKLPDHAGAPILVLNDEAHHCYRPPEKAAKDRESKDYEREAGVWFGALKALFESKKYRIGLVADLSATPMFLNLPKEIAEKSEDAEPSPLFPWTVCDTPLIEAVECGLTKIPRAASEDAHGGEEAEKWRNVFKSLPDKKRNLASQRTLPREVSEPLKVMVGKLEDEMRRRTKSGVQPPVLILIANNIDNAEALYDYVAGTHSGSGRWKKGQCGDALSNVEADGSGTKAHPPTMLVHSKLHDVSNGSFGEKRVMKRQGGFIPKNEEESTDDYDLRLKSMFDTVAQEGKPGEHLRCIVSVSMLTEGWDCRSVTHVFGFRPFKSQLLCEQAVGRALRRTAHPSPGSALPGEEYADVAGIPFEFMRGGEESPRPPVETYLVKASTKPIPPCPMPQVDNYEREMAPTFLQMDGKLPIEGFLPEDVSAKTITFAGLTGEKMLYELSPPRPERWQALAYEASELAVNKLLTKSQIGEREERRMVLFAQLLEEIKGWGRRILKAHGTKGMELATRLPAEAIASKIRSLATAKQSDWIVRPTFSPNALNLSALADPLSRVPYRTAQTPLHENTAGKQPHSRAPCHSRLEADAAGTFDMIPDVLCWTRNFRVGWRIPYRQGSNDALRWYEPDFAVRLNGDVDGFPVMLMVECKGPDDDPADTGRKEEYVRDWWIPCVNRHAVLHGRKDWGLWDYEIIGRDRGNLMMQVKAAIKRHRKNVPEIICGHVGKAASK